MKPGGSLLLYSTDKQREDEPSFYRVGSNYFYDLKFSADVVVSAVKEAGLNVLSVDHIKKNEDPAVCNCGKYMFVCAGKDN